MDNLHYLLQKASSNSNKNLEILSNFFSQEEKQLLTQRSVSIVGTNGKTSTATVLNELLSRNGLSTILFTSPHLVNVNERIQIKKEIIKDIDLDRGMEKVRVFEDKNKITLGYFESIFLIAATYFLNNNLDIFIVEAGIGGRLDTTSILNSQIVCLTNIGLDHTELLGTTIEEILHEKILVSKNVKQFINGSAEIHTKYEHLIKESLKLKNEDYHLGFKDDEYVNSSSIVRTNYLKSNQSNAIKVSKVILGNLNKTDNFNNDPLYLENIKKMKTEGRFQVIQNLPSLKIIDGAHNPSGIKAFFDLLEYSYNIGDVNNFDCYVGFNKNKDYREMLKTIWLKRYLNIKVLEDGSFFKQQKTYTLEKFFIANNKDIQKSTLKEFHLSNKPSILLGSLYLIGEYIKEYK
ncbi:Mur ligase family protein [Acidimicrobiia bacterium]|jgi:dihydrofolate synthase/folylpolyglutamate synthase|nr:Mur ligase family protein [Acidimicrobiia bacterium]MDA8922489.1 Mur ligase family protein [Acidimicrobiia bacterium]MDA9036944.1 Mur ligase family protein [Acidimicrobiia bacterium]MDA9862819.1 Mur ligase family protein [Acidimicrobiia bacterium]MDC3277842.1 Mur ligase family protein [Acidimicrobiia bacterium]|tara:strand:- start:2947 stop:4161 length:1215 start_codon:yes stop_codon:yes gene_type:complete